MLPMKGKWALSILGGVVIGALGSGAWKHAMEPALLWMRDALLNVTTFGLDRYRDALYAEVALGNQEGVALSSFSLLVGLVFGLGTSPFLLLLFRRVTRGNEGGGLQSAGRRYELPVLVFGSAMCVALFLMWNHVKYVNAAVTHVRQMEAIVAPVVSSDELMIMRSQFAQIASREDYVGLTACMESVAEEAGLRVPEFSAW